MSSDTDDKIWYNQFYREQNRRDLLIRPEIVERYRRYSKLSKLFYLEQLFQLLGDVKNRKILYLACGVESSGILLALRGAQVWAFDLALEAVKQQQKMGIANATVDRTRFAVGNCGQLPFQDHAFDLVIGIGILHHLQEDLDTPCSEIARVIKKDGFAVFEEPITRSSLLAWVRKRLPIALPIDASPVCRPLAGNALQHLGRRFHLETHWFGFLARLDRFLFKTAPLEFASRWRRWTAYILHYVDFLLLRIPGLDRLAGIVVLKLSRTPRPAHGQ